MLASRENRKQSLMTWTVNKICPKNLFYALVQKPVFSKGIFYQTVIFSGKVYSGRGTGWWFLLAYHKKVTFSVFLPWSDYRNHDEMSWLLPATKCPFQSNNNDFYAILLYMFTYKIGQPMKIDCEKIVAILTAQNLQNQCIQMHYNQSTVCLYLVGSSLRLYE